MGVTSIRLSPEVETPLKILSERLDRSKNYLINQAVKEYVARQAMEDSRWEDTLKALASVKKDKGFDEQEVVSWIQSWGTDNESSPPSK